MPQKVLPGRGEKHYSRGSSVEIGVFLASLGGRDMKRTYKCPSCGQIAVRTAEEMKANYFTKGQIPAFLLCGKCYSKGESIRMWGDDIPEEDRDGSKYDTFGVRIT